MESVGGDVVIYGLGVAGSTLAYLASSMGFKVTGFDMAPRYGKACGDVVTLRGFTWEVLRVTGSILEFVRRFEIRVGGVEVAYIDFKEPVWAMVDKPKLVNTLRSMAEADGARVIRGRGRPRADPRAFVVDARGPYAHSPGYSVLTVRVVAKARWEHDLALIDFDPWNLGFYWIFPLDDNRINLGVGLASVGDGGILKELALKYYRRLAKTDPIVLDVRGAPVAVEAPVRLEEEGVYKIGEAAGLVNSTSGEGNRYAIHSAIALAKALKHNTGLKGYKELLGSVLDEITLSRSLLRLVKTLGPKTSSLLLSNAPREFWAYWLKGRLTRRTLLNTLRSMPHTLTLSRLKIQS